MTKKERENSPEGKIEEKKIEEEREWKERLITLVTFCTINYTTHVLYIEQ